jgi:hypothetical protein
MVHPEVPLVECGSGMANLLEFKSSIPQIVALQNIGTGTLVLSGFRSPDTQALRGADGAQYITRL